MMEIKLHVDVIGKLGRWSAACNVPELYRYEFEPLRTCDDGFIAFATGEKLTGSESVKQVKKLRKDAAEILARELTNMIIEAMESGDTHNGYSMEQSNDRR